MLVLTRKKGEEIILANQGVTIRVVAVGRKAVRLGINAPSSVGVRRHEVPGQAPEAAGRCSKSSEESPKAIHVVIADTDEQLLASYRKSLSEMGFSVTTATSGPECLSQLCTHPPDLLVLDSDLPLGGGCGVIAMMRQEHTMPLIPVLIHAWEDDKEIQRDRALPIVGHARRPLSPDRLANRIRQLVGDFRRQLPCT
ncbi:MAG: carbon storage regulator [Pirellulaceae bacterium]